jgi:hypothetical protein
MLAWGIIGWARQELGVGQLELVPLVVFEDCVVLARLHPASRVYMSRAKPMENGAPLPLPFMMPVMTILFPRLKRRVE